MTPCLANTNTRSLFTLICSQSQHNVIKNTNIRWNYRNCIHLYVSGLTVYGLQIVFAMQFLLKPLYIFVLLGLVMKCNLFLCCRNSEQKMNDPSQSSFIECTFTVLKKRRQKHNCCSKGFICNRTILQYSKYAISL